MAFSGKSFSLIFMDVTQKKTGDPRGIIIQVFFIFAVTAAAIKSGERLLEAVNLAQYFRSFTAVLLIGIPFIFIRWTDINGSILGFGRIRAKTDMRPALFIGLPVIALYAAAWIGYQYYYRNRQFIFHWDIALILVVVEQLCLVSLPEELFFRGFLQGLLTPPDPDRQSHFKAFFTLPIIMPAILFAAAHFITEPKAFRLATVFPAMLFGWLRNRYHSIWPGVMIHAAANVAVFLLQNSFQ